MHKKGPVKIRLVDAKCEKSYIGVAGVPTVCGRPVTHQLMTYDGEKQTLLCAYCAVDWAETERPP
jgi:hypothetical protein